MSAPSTIAGISLVRLDLAAHRAMCDPRLAVAQQHPGVSVCIVRFDGTRAFAWSGSRLKNAPRFW